MNKTKIKSQILVILTILLGIFYGCSGKKQSFVQNIDDKTLQEAIEYGKSKAGVSAYEFMEPWSVYLGYEFGKGRAVYLSPFLQAAQIAKNAKEKRINPDINIIKKVVATKLNTLDFLVTTYGNEPDAPRRTKAYLIYNNMKIDPIYSHFPPYSEFNRDYYHQINGEVRFSARDIPRNAIVKLYIEIAPKKEKKEEQHRNHHDHEHEIVVGKVAPERILTEFVFDLSKYK
ncbi:MAG: hypothetical protein NC831_00575 [Candidatus Omnitrophica bacterium]|nr:hypothetical protein [Candidatus Omnitrophota bacterium]MCM8828551.1 hypothetical protein [Candidatus Omnitrophota bacterium]